MVVSPAASPATASRTLGGSSRVSEQYVPPLTSLFALFVHRVTHGPFAIPAASRARRVQGGSFFGHTDPWDREVVAVSLALASTTLVLSPMCRPSVLSSASTSAEASPGTRQRKVYVSVFDSGHVTSPGFQQGSVLAPFGPSPLPLRFPSLSCGCVPSKFLLHCSVDAPFESYGCMRRRHGWRRVVTLNRWLFFFRCPCRTGTESLDTMSFHSPNHHGMQRPVSAVFPRAPRDILRAGGSEDAGDIAQVRVRDGRGHGCGHP